MRRLIAWLRLRALQARLDAAEQTVADLAAALADANSVVDHLQTQLTHAHREYLDHANGSCRAHGEAA